LEREENNWHPYSEIEPHIEINLSALPQVKKSSSPFVDKNLKIVDATYCRTHDKAIGNFV
jgi:hypothetical protein